MTHNEETAHDKPPRFIYHWTYLDDGPTQSAEDSNAFGYVSASGVMPANTPEDAQRKVMEMLIENECAEPYQIELADRLITAAHINDNPEYLNESNRRLISELLDARSEISEMQAELEKLKAVEEQTEAQGDVV